jgi:hypothetical protein
MIETTYLHIGLDDPKRYYFNQAMGRDRLHVDDIRIEDANYLANLELQIQQSSAKTMVLSYEGFIDLENQSLQKMKAFLSNVSNTTKVIVYFREPFSFAISALSQRAKSGIPLWDEVPVRDWLRICEGFSKEFGKKNLIARKFASDSLPKGDVRLDFFSLLGLSLQAVETLHLSESEDNSSLSAEAILIAESLREKSESENLTLDAFGERYALILESISGSKFRLSDKQVDEVKCASAENLEYLDRTFGIKFDSSKPKKNKSEPPLFGKNFVKSMASCIYNLTKTLSIEILSDSNKRITETISLRPNYFTPHFILHPIKPNKTVSIERGQVISTRINFLLTHDISQLEINLHLFDSNGKLAFGIGNEQLGQVLTNVTSGSYCASFHLVADLPTGRYSIGFSAAEKKTNKVIELAWYGKYIEFEVQDSIVVDALGYASLPAEMTFSPTIDAKKNNVIDFAKGSIELAGDMPVFKAGETCEISTKINNRSDIGWIGDVFRPVRLSYHWLKGDSEMFTLDGLRTSLPAGGVRPGQVLTAKMSVTAPNEPGAYTLMLTLVQENVGWLESIGLKGASLEVEVKST